MEDPHLCRCSEFLILLAYGLELHGVAELLPDPIRPFLELLACPLETMVAMPELSGRQRLEFSVVLGIRCCQDSRLWASEFEKYPLKSCQPGLIKVLYDF